ncbi:N-acetylmuramoyl-L-alanine amidase [Selenomonas ruminantium]|uniref:N-acetylmuramoyl-L-alanine amidase n=1 Tax=Selenomonas ruminantium TaxID=971 RepID=UPI0026F2F422|nr:N-acetylmuramoyl-L-alanine amidase [Selenomonas ruminantium]
MAYLKLSSVSAARASFCVLRNTTMPAVLVETGFIDSEDVNLLTRHGDDIARALARGVTDYANFLASA